MGHCGFFKGYRRRQCFLYVSVAEQPSTLLCGSCERALLGQIKTRLHFGEVWSAYVTGTDGAEPACKIVHGSAERIAMARSQFVFFVTLISKCYEKWNTNVLGPHYK